MWASFWGHLQVVERILAAGAQPDLQNNVRITSECTQVLNLLKEVSTLGVFACGTLVTMDHELVVCGVDEQGKINGCFTYM